MLQRSVNEGFSGGEKKRNEIFHMAVLEPRAGDSRRDRLRASTSTRSRSSRAASTRCAPRPLVHRRHPLPAAAQLHRADFVHVLSDGMLVRSGGRELALELEEKGYGWLEAAGREGVIEMSQLPNVSTRIWPSTAASCRRAAARRRHGCATCARAARRGSPTLGFPTVRQEEWRFTNVAPIADTRSGWPRRRRPTPPSCAARVAHAGARGAHRDSQRPLRSRAVASNGCRAACVAGSLAQRDRRGAPEVAHLGQLAWEQAPFAALNTAFLEDGAFIVIPAGAVLTRRSTSSCINGGAGKIDGAPAVR